MGNEGREGVEKEIVFISEMQSSLIYLERMWTTLQSNLNLEWFFEEEKKNCLIFHYVWQQEEEAEGREKEQGQDSDLT